MKKFLILILCLVSYSANSQSLKLLYPNGGEKIVGGEELLLQWQTDNPTNLVEIEYSLDNGNNWNFLDTATGTSYLWKKVPIANREKCLIKIQTVRKNNIQLVQTLRGHNSWVNSISYNTDGSKLASAGLDYSSKIWDVATNRIEQNYKGYTAYVESVAFSNDGKNVLTGCDRGFIRKWNLDSNNVFELALHNSGIRSLVFSQDNLYFASTGKEDNDVNIWDYATMKISKTLKGHQSPAWTTSFSPDGKYLASSSIDQTIKIWEIDSSKVLFTLSGHSNPVSGVTYSNDGSLIVSASINGEIKIWDASNGNLLKSFSGGNAHVYSLALSTDNKTIAVGDEEYKINILDASSGQLIKSFQGHEYYILSLTFHPTTNTIASSSSDRTIKIWNVDATEIPLDKSDSTFSIFIDPSNVASSGDNEWFKVIQFSDKAYIEFINTSWNNGLTTVKVFSTLGLLLEEKSYSTDQGIRLEIDTKNYSNGQYFVKVETPTRTETASFIVVK